MSENTLALVALLSPASFAITSISSMLQPGIHPEVVKKTGMLSAISSILISFVNIYFVINDGLIESYLIGTHGLGFSLRLDPLSVLMQAMISLLGFIVYKFSINYLDGDQRQGVFLGRLAGTIAAVQLLVISGNIGLLMVAWILTSVCLHRLLLFYPERPGAIVVARKKFIVARLGDASLFASIVLLYNQFGTGNLEAIFQAVKSGNHSFDLEGPAIFLTLAALFKSAQFPTHGWLVEVMETPTPVSALLHAGLLNAGPYLIIRMAFIIDASTYAPIILMTIGGITALFASVVFMTQTSVKTTLGYSSVAHMGFSLLVCGLGVYPAAMLHLVSHSFYKAHAFLSSGSLIDEVRASKIALPKRLGSPMRIGLGILLSLAIYLTFAYIYRINPQQQLPLIAVGVVIVLALSRILTSAIDSNGGLALITRAIVFALMVTVSFFTLEASTQYLISSQLPQISTPSSSKIILMGMILGIYTLTVGIQILAPKIILTETFQPYAVHLRNGLYANVLFDRLVGALYAQPSKNRLKNLEEKY